MLVFQAAFALRVGLTMHIQLTLIMLAFPERILNDQNHGEKKDKKFVIKVPDIFLYVMSFAFAICTAISTIKSSFVIFISERKLLNIFGMQNIMQQCF